MSTSALQSINEVDIDPEGTFKYILIKVYGPEKEGKEPAKTIVRGYKRCPYHNTLGWRVSIQGVGKRSELKKT